ncbi:MAG TPA: hypothetical protein VFE50_09135 [Cyclobacteriaceae bacterium]|nr:hypothetical protein [Cyclobacteriaceae bacterium]
MRFCHVNRASIYIILFFLSFSASFAQNGNGKGVRLPFQDSVRLALENTRNTDAAAIGMALSNVWNGLGQDLQIQVMKQAKVMKKKGFKLRPHVQYYFGAIVDAMNIEKADNERIASYIKVAGKVIENEEINKAATFFLNSREFFRHHALHYDKSARIYVRDDNYEFDYIAIEIPAPVVDDTTQTESLDDLSKEDAAPTTWEDEPVDTTSIASTPFWQQPIYIPEPIGAVIRFDKATLNFATPYDSTFLTNTKGTFQMSDNLFIGEGGRFDWSSVSLNPDEVYCDLKKFYFDTSRPRLKAEQVKMVYKGRVDGQVDGVFEFASTRHRDSISATYPRFVSYESNIRMLGLADEKLKYTGGFALNGRRIYSAAINGGNSRIEVMGASTKKFEAQSTLFEFRDSSIVSRNAAIEIYQGNDSIFHPGVQLTYNYAKQNLTLSRTRGVLKDTPFTSSYFRVDFTGDVFRWALKGDSTGADSLNIFTSAGLSQAPMVLESQDYFDPNDFKLLKGVGFSFHPLVIVANYVNNNGVREFNSADLMRPTGKSFNEIHGAMTFLAQKGMIDYDLHTGMVRVKDKVLHINDARKNETDYDNMKIHSIVDGPANATINFPKGYMTVRGVEEFKISDSLNVVIKPDSSVITLLQNRDIKFNGKITAGNFEINGKDFMLKYDSFFINLNHIDSIRFYVTELNAKGQPVRRRVNNAMVGADSTAAAAGGLDAGGKKTQGTLFINRPDNKSGRERIPNFPRLDASAGGVIYFDRREVLDGAYDRSVFFVVPPFKLDSLSDADPAAINFDGTFVSSGMFPSFKEKLHTQADKSLGFSHAVPATGYPLYNTEGKLFGAMGLDNAGIRATGKIEYLAATVESEDFVFYPDSVVGRGHVGELKEKQFGAAWYPQITLPEFRLKWLPKQDQFGLKNLRDPFSLYNATAQLEGELIVSKQGTSGDGKLITRGSELTSDQMSFSAKDFGARHAKFQVKTTNPDKPALAGKDVRLKFDLEQNFAELSPEIEGEAAFEFPYAQFKTSITDAHWDLNTQKVTMTKDADVPLEDSYFYTTREDLDSLVFNAEKAEYDIKTQQLKVSGIPYIVVADAKITPDHNEVLILENSKIGQLKNTTIVLDTLNAYHRLTEGVVDIISRKEFSGYATYQYVNALNDTFAIKMTDFHLEAINDATKSHRRLGLGHHESVATQQTVGVGAVEDKANLMIAPRIFYKGDMTMYATKPALQLRGYVKLDLKKIKGYNTWIHHEQSGDEKEIYLDFDHATTEEGNKVEAGLHFAADNSLYITFVFDKKNQEDEDFFVPSGSLYFDSTEFKIEDRAKAAGEKLSGKVFAYNEDKQEVRFEGPVNFFRGGLKDFKITATALGSGNLETNDIKMNSFIMTEMNIPPQAYDLMAKNIMEVIKNEGVAEEALGDQTELLYKIADIVGERAVKDYEAKSLQAYVPLATVPGLAKPLVFSSVNLKWSQKYKAFYSTGNLGLSNIGKNDINGAFDGFMEIRKNEDGTQVFHVFFKVSPDAWYYFGYEDNRMMIQSSDPAFNDLIAKKSNASKAKVGELVFIPGSDQETLAFISRFRKDYLGIESDYDLGATTAKDKKKKDDEKDDGF